ncbi:MAG: hypothetical protein N839_0008025 [Desulfofustis sp. PB-SRB1]|jgi:hypothetical protein|nr:hypothetical protein [Desulfofustis sp. PB-SRB1]MBM1002349.1 hypothetical protein [Desulfofustis sp. PB-SRB1]HBH29230.1 hypothetical protein [Desulfofustis sp.]HBH30995.1 hypothetical protein [Desulfofustis sp.]
MESRYRAVYTGVVKDGYDHDEVVDQLVAITSLSPEKAEQLVNAGTAVIIKKDMEEDAAEQLCARLGAIGMEMEIRVGSPRSTQQPSVAPEPTSDPAREPADSEEPSPPPDTAIQLEKPEQVIAGADPYAPPTADLTPEQQTTTAFFDQPRKVKAGRGWTWIVDAYKLFMKAPWKLLAIYVIALIIVSLPAFIPIVGTFVQSILYPIIGAGLVMSAHTLHTGNTLSTGQVFDGFRHNRNQLLLIGLIYMAGVLVMFLIMFLVFGSMMIPMFLNSGNPEAMESMMGGSPLMFALIPLLILALSIPLIMAVWFAPALAALVEVPAVYAMKRSFRACLQNIVPFLVYGLATFVVGFIAALIVGICTAVAGFIFGDGFGGLVFFIPIIIVSIVLFIPFMVILGLSNYTAFRDIFSAQA